MSRAQGIEGLLASQTGTPRIPSKVLPDLEIHGLRGEEIRRVGELPRISLWAIGHQPGKHHDPRDLRTGFFRVIVRRRRQPPSQLLMRCAPMQKCSRDFSESFIFARTVISRERAYFACVRKVRLLLSGSRRRRTGSSSCRLPVIPLLLAKPCESNGASGGDLDDGIPVVLDAGTLNHRHERALMDAADVLQIVLVAVTLKDRQHLAGFLEDFLHFGTILDAVNVADIQPLMGKDYDLLAGRLQVGS